MMMYMVILESSFMTSVLNEDIRITCTELILGKHNKPGRSRIKNLMWSSKSVTEETPISIFHSIPFLSRCQSWLYIFELSRWENLFIQKEIIDPPTWRSSSNPHVNPTSRSERKMHGLYLFTSSINTWY